MSASIDLAALRMTTAKVLPFHRHEPVIAIKRVVGVPLESIVCPCKVCGKVMEFPVEAE